jgi:molybdopterin/thiamine biosynthesis adenylyltransferase
LLTQEELERYNRQILLIGRDKQEKIKNATVLIVGVGGLGSAAAYYLTAAGIGRLILVDDGLVELNNLQRQILYTVKDIGKPKVFAAKERLEKLNPNVNIISYNTKFNEELADKLVSEVDLVIDALDNWDTRIILDKAAWRYGKPFIHAGVYGFYGQLTVLIPGKTPCLRCIFPKKPKTQHPLPIFATTPGVLGVLEANEALKLISGVGKVLANKLLIYDGSAGLFKIVEITMKPDCPICYE